jgi:hypothetical protein
MYDKVRTEVEVRAVLHALKWWYRLEPFPHFIAHDVFARPFYAALECALREILRKGLASGSDPGCFSRNMPNSDAYAWNFPPDIDGPLSVFYSREWHDRVALLTGINATDDVNGALHHHQMWSKTGSVHDDLARVWFSVQPRADGINPMDLRRCSYTTGKASRPGVKVRSAVRAATMIYYFGNRPWLPGDGGETGLYYRSDQRVGHPTAIAPPVNNSILIFECTPFSHHSFISNRRHPRNSAILWLHASEKAVENRWGRGRVAGMLRANPQP